MSIYSKNIRIISRIDIKNEFVIKGINLEGLRKIGDPLQLVSKYYKGGIDEILFMDAVASLYQRNNLFGIIAEAIKEIFVPITIGGGIRKMDDIEKALKSGADKISINTQAVKNPNFIKEASLFYGSQSIVGSIEAKRKNNSWEVYIENGRQETGINVIEWAKQLESLGIGELILTSIDQEGTQRGFDLNLIETISKNISIPIIVSGGAGSVKDMIELSKNYDISGIAIASLLHYNKYQLKDIKAELLENKINVRG